MRNVTTIRRIERLLEVLPETRNNDKLLLENYWRMFDHVDVAHGYGDFANDATSPETITRIRRRIQASGRFLPEGNMTTRRRRITTNAI